MEAGAINEGDDDSKCSGFLDTGNDMLSYRENDDDHNIEYDGLDDNKVGDNHLHTNGRETFSGGYSDHINEGYDEENDFDQVLQGEWGEEEIPCEGLQSERSDRMESGRAESGADMDTDDWLGSTVRSDVTIQYPEVSPLCGGRSVQRTRDDYDPPLKGPEKCQTNNPTLLL